MIINVQCIIIWMFLQPKSYPFKFEDMIHLWAVLRHFSHLTCFHLQSWIVKDAKSYIFYWYFTHCIQYSLSMWLHIIDFKRNSSDIIYCISFAGAKIKIDRESDDLASPLRKCLISGTSDQIFSAKGLLDEKIAEDNEIRARRGDMGIPRNKRAPRRLDTAQGKKTLWWNHFFFLIVKWTFSFWPCSKLSFFF